MAKTALGSYCSQQEPENRDQVIWGKIVDKQLGCVRDVIARKFRIWVALVEESRIREMRKCKGFRDERLKGKRPGAKIRAAQQTR
jgi:hypothetical protein